MADRRNFIINPLTSTIGRTHSCFAIAAEERSYCISSIRKSSKNKTGRDTEYLISYWDLGGIPEFQLRVHILVKSWALTGRLFFYGPRAPARPLLHLHLPDVATGFLLPGEEPVRRRAVDFMVTHTVEAPLPGCIPLFAT